MKGIKVCCGKMMLQHHDLLKDSEEHLFKAPQVILHWGNVGCYVESKNLKKATNENC